MRAERRRAWWRALRSDTRAQLRLALPLMVAQLAQTGMALVDTVMTGRFSALDLAAVSVGSSLWVPLQLLIVGIVLAVTPVVATARGANRLAGVDAYLRDALLLGLLLGVAAAALLWMAGSVFALAGVEEGVASRGIDYLRALSLGFPALALYQVLRSFSEGMAYVRPVLWIGLGGLAFNVPANAILIYGLFGLPAMGAFGCGLATALSLWVMLIAMLVWMRCASRLRWVRPFRVRVRPKLANMREVLGIGVPIGLAIFFETSLFAVIALLVAGLGAAVIAAHQIALNVASLLFMLPLSLGMALTVRVGHALGVGGPALARRRAWNGQLIATGLGVTLASLMLLVAEPVAAVYTPDTDIRALAVSLITLAALFQLSDTLQVNAAGALRGYRDTRFVMLVTLPCYWGVGLGVGVWLGRSALPPGPLGVHGFWMGLLAGLTAAAVVLLWRLHRMTRRHNPVRPTGALGPMISANPPRPATPPLAG